MILVTFYLRVTTLLAARQLESSGPAANSPHELSKVPFPLLHASTIIFIDMIKAAGLLPRQKVGIIPATKSHEQLAFEVAQAESAAKLAAEVACLSRGAGASCTREVRRDLASLVAAASGIKLPRFISNPQRRQKVAPIPATNSPEEQAFQAAQQESAARLAAEVACLSRGASGSPCTREIADSTVRSLLRNLD
ncbi:hypothetical protein DL96DRAFT_1819824 [Flagelloscypha sp. PMI_526]|nr:hypothetical protein DL96DRAFT_1819824 [Flagelloscypha sp. PMI_526]